MGSRVGRGEGSTSVAVSVSVGSITGSFVRVGGMVVSVGQGRGVLVGALVMMI